MEHEREKTFKADLMMWILPLRFFVIYWKELTLYYNNDIIELTHECSRVKLKFRGDIFRETF